MARQALRALTLSLLVLCACAEAPPMKITQDDLAPLFPYLYALDPAAPFAVRQLPFAGDPGADLHYGHRVSTYGVTMEIWPDHAVLTMDATPLAGQLRGVRRFADPAKQATRIRRNRWTVDLQQCPAVAELYAEAMSIRETAGAATEPPQWGSGRGLTLQFSGVEVPSEQSRFYQNWMAKTWRALDACTKASGQN